MSLAIEAFENANGFSALTADELYFINGGSGSYCGTHGNQAYSVTIGYTEGQIGNQAPPPSTATLIAQGLTYLGAKIVFRFIVYPGSGNDKIADDCAKHFAGLD